MAPGGRGGGGRPARRGKGPCAGLREGRAGEGPGGPREGLARE